MLEQALGFFSQGAGILGQLALVGQAEQLPFRHGPAEEKRQAVGAGQIVEASRLFAQVEEMRGREQGGEARPQRALETLLLYTLLFEKSEIGGNVAIGHGSAEGGGGQALDCLGGIT